MSVGCHSITGDTELGTVMTWPFVVRPREEREGALKLAGGGNSPANSRETRKGSMEGTQFKGRLYKEKEREGCLSGRLRKAKTFWVVHVKGRMGRRGRPHGALCPSPLSLEVPQPRVHSGS